MAFESKKDLMSDAKSFCDGLTNVFMLKKRDAQTRHLLEKAKILVESLVAENQKLSNPGTPRQSRGGGMGQLWVKLDELKRENEDLRRHKGKSQDDRGLGGKSPGPGEMLIADLQKCKAENELLRNRLETDRIKCKEYEAINGNLKDDFKRMKFALETSQLQLAKAKTDYRTLETSLKSATSENDTLKQRFTNSVKPMVRSDNRHVENINERCRPSLVAMRYNTLESQEWMDAKESLEDLSSTDEETVNKFLCSLLMNCMTSCHEVFDILSCTLSDILQNPTSVISMDDKGIEVAEKKLPEELREHVLAILRQNSEAVDTAPVVEIAIKKTAVDFKHFIRREYHKEKAVQQFMIASTKLLWQMMVQQPPMMLCTSDVTYNDVKHKLWWSCDQSKSRRIQYYIWPTLYDFENGHVLVKGCVYAN